MNQQKEKWRTEHNSQAKLGNYRQYKSEYWTVQYVKMKLSGGLRSVIAQMRSSTLPLKIETGRFHNVKVYERLCEGCNLNLVESESHYIMFVCPCYKELRNY